MLEAHPLLRLGHLFLHASPPPSAPLPKGGRRGEWTVSREDDAEAAHEGGAKGAEGCRKGRRM